MSEPAIQRIEHPSIMAAIPRVFPSARFLKIALILSLALLAAFALDGMIADYLAFPWSNGQCRAAVDSMRAWGEGSTIVVVLLGISVVRPSESRRCLVIGFCCLMAAISVSTLKPLSRRLRPAEVHARGLAGHWHLEGNANSSFPSGHVATAFAFARGLSLAYPPLRTLSIVGASGTAWSRMADSRHYLSDCVAGGILGWALATPIFQFFMRKEKVPTP